MHVHALLPDLLQQRREALYTVRAAHVYADGDVAVTGMLQMFHQCSQQVGGQIVHAVKAAVFQYFECDTFAGTG